MDNTIKLAELVKLLAKIPEDMLHDIYEYNSEHRRMMKRVHKEIETAQCAFCRDTYLKRDMVRIEGDDRTIHGYYCSGVCMVEEEFSARFL